MELNFFLRGAILGFSIAAPVGPIGVLCIRKTMQYGRLSGLFSGLGAAAADVIYGIIAAYGLTFISNFLVREKFWLHMIGGIFLLYLGVKTFFSQPVMASGQSSSKTYLGDFISTFFLTLTNPMTIVSYIAVFAGLGLAETRGNYIEATWLVTGIFVGSCLWWLMLSEGVTLFRKKVSIQVMKWVNRLAGLIIFGFGIMAYLSINWK